MNLQDEVKLLERKLEILKEIVKLERLVVGDCKGTASEVTAWIDRDTLPFNPSFSQ
jgi:hypothetical protein